MQIRITYSEFLGWVEYLQWEARQTSKQDLYLAQIACENRRNWVKDKKIPKLYDFVFKIPEPAPKLNPAQRVARSKAVWGMVARVQKENTQIYRQSRERKTKRTPAKAKKK